MSGVGAGDDALLRGWQTSMRQHADADALGLKSCRGGSLDYDRGRLPVPSSLAPQNVNWVW